MRIIFIEENEIKNKEYKIGGKHMSDMVIDALGDSCPLPVIKTLKALEGITEATLIKIHVDNETAVENLLKMAAGKGLEARSEKKEDGHYIVDIEALMQRGEKEEPEEKRKSRNGKTVVAVGSKELGTGDEELGNILMKGFIYALSQQKELPDTLIFYNGGAKIPIEGEIFVEDLKYMESQGVEIITCGTCLDFYGLKEKLAAGSVGNMYQIVEEMMCAESVIKP